MICALFNIVFAVPMNLARQMHPTILMFSHPIWHIQILHHAPAIIHFFTAWDTMTSSTASGHGIENTKTFQTWQVLSSCFSCTLTIFMNLAMAMAKIVFQNLSCQGSFVLLHVFFQYYGQIGSLFILLWFQILPCLQHLLILRFRRTEFHCYTLSDTIVVFSIQISFFFT